MTERTEKSQVLFSALVEYVVDGGIAIDTEGYHKKEGVMTLITDTVGRINIVAIIWFIFKVRNLTAAMSIRFPQVTMP